MKYGFFLLAILCFAASGAYSQILNGGFEDWKDGVPDHWTYYSNNDLGKRYQMDSSSDSHSGNYCLKITVNYDYARPAPTFPQIRFFTNKADTNRGSLIPHNSHSLSFWFKSNYTSHIMQYFGYGIGHDSVEIGSSEPLQIPIANMWTRYSVSWEQWGVDTSVRNYIVLDFSAFWELDANKKPYDIYELTTYIDDITFDTMYSHVPQAPSSDPISISISPNPISNHGNLYYYCTDIESAKNHPSIFDLTGREVMQLPSVPSASGDGAIPFDCDGLPNGLYYLRFEAGGTVMMKKIIVQH